VIIEKIELTQSAASAAESVNRATMPSSTESSPPPR
jgi:hypothetical protein